MYCSRSLIESSKKDPSIRADPDALLPFIVRSKAWPAYHSPHSTIFSRASCRMTETLFHTGSLWVSVSVFHAWGVIIHLQGHSVSEFEIAEIIIVVSTFGWWFLPIRRKEIIWGFIIPCRIKNRPCTWNQQVQPCMTTAWASPPGLWLQISPPFSICQG